MRTTCKALVGLCFSLLAGAASAADLPLGERVEGRTSGDEPASFSFEVEGAGALAVVVRANDDVLISVLTDSDRPVADGRIDIDFQGDTGAEQGTIILNRAGAYVLRVEPFDAAAEFVMIANWLPLAEVAAGPTGSAADAVDLKLDETVEEQLGRNNVEDWYRLVVPDDGLLLVATRARSGDLILDCYAADDPTVSLDRSDRDISGDLGREAILLDVRAGEVYYFVVTAHDNEASYSVRAVLTDN